MGKKKRWLCSLGFFSSWGLSPLRKISGMGRGQTNVESSKNQTFPPYKSEWNDHVLIFTIEFMHKKLFLWYLGQLTIDGPLSHISGYHNIIWSSSKSKPNSSISTEKKLKKKKKPTHLLHANWSVHTNQSFSFLLKQYKPILTIKKSRKKMRIHMNALAPPCIGLKKKKTKTQFIPLMSRDSRLHISAQQQISFS